MKKVTNFKLLTLLLMLCTSFLSAQTNWNGGGDGTSWEDPLNWTAGIPDAVDRVIIGAGNTVIISSAAEAESVANFGDLTIQPNHSLTIIGASTFDGIFNQGTVINKGTINLDNSGRIAIFNFGNFTNDNFLNIGQNVGLGDITLDGIRNSSVFNNNGHLTIDNAGERGIRNEVGGAFTNTATLDIGQNGGAGNIVSNGIVNGGLGAATFTNDGGTINISNTNIDAILNTGTGTFNNNGCAALLNLTDARITNGGTFNNNLGTIIENASDNSEISTNSGTVQNLNGGTFTIGSGNAAIEATGHIWTGCLGTDWATPGNWHTGTVPTATDDVTIPDMTTNDPIISTAALAKSVTVQTDASLVVAAAGSLTINGSTSHTAGSNTFTSALFNEGTVTNNGNITLGSTASVGTYGIYNQAIFNNNSGEVKVDRSTGAGIWNFSGTFTNTAAITIGGTTGIGSNGIWNRATFNNNNGGEVKVDRFNSSGIYNNDGTFTNSAAITIGGTASVGTYGIYNQAIFTNNNGEVKVDRSTGTGIWNESGTFTNSAAITIGGTASAGTYGIFNRATFNNNGGEINIDDIVATGILNGGTFTNQAEINIGAIKAIGVYGIYNGRNFSNGMSGEINIDDTGNNGVVNENSNANFTNQGKINIGANKAIGVNGVNNWDSANFANEAEGEININDIVGTGISNSASIFTNEGKINIGADKSIGGYGVSNTSTSNFTNETWGEINIDRSTSGGIFNNIGSFTNEAAITIGAIASVGANGIENRATFNNNTCAEIYLFDNLNNSGTFTNAGLFTVNTTQTHTNSALTNNGILAYPQGNPIPNVTNNEIVIAPTTANACDVISPAFDLGSPVDFTIAGIFTDEAATLSAGTYETAPNTFTPTVPLAEGSMYSYFVQIMDPVGGCTRVLPWDLTTENCITLSGNIVWEHDLNTPVTNATVTLSGNDSGSDDTDANGDYAIPTTGGSSLTLTPSKTGGEYEGVDVADVTRIQQHVTFVDRFDDGYKAIAADVNQSNSVTGLDAAVIFHAINGNPSAETIFENPSWRFVEATHTFMDENAPWTPAFPEDISLTNVMADVFDQDFVGAKMGDVNGTWATPTPLLTSPLNWTVPNLALKAGQTLRIPFRANGLPDVAAWQFALRFDTDYLRFERALSTAAFPLKDENFGAWQAGRGELRSVFAVPQGLVLPKDEVLFELEFQVVFDGLRLSEVLRLDDDILDGRVYDMALNGGAVALAFAAVETRRIASLPPGEAALGFALEQNIPNPFSNETLVRFELPEAGEAVFSVHDVQGRLLYEQRGFLDAGLHEVRLDASRLGATGVLSYTLRCGAHSATRRMVLVR